MSVNPEDPSRVLILPDATAVSLRVAEIVNSAATTAISEKGEFNLAIPGGSILNMLGSIDNPEWASKTNLAYVNHKCVDNNDINLSTHAKATEKFLNSWEGSNVLTLSGNSDSGFESERYSTLLKDLPQLNNLPVFDLCLIGVGDDGHIGSLYPGRTEILEENESVLPVNMKKPGSITLTLPTILNSKRIVIAACGVSEKYPKGKSEGMKRGIQGEETVESFPAVGLRGKGEWIIDEAAGGKLVGY
ncbi:hypothetical protein TL16_g04838 [Triparma laevis f. inornata]|uniref:Glucosamine/galactosamine-6-phosphate isomerase domain-containing protein n=2 Tax=Triparma laevis TaxID=1534972 RepID=A0A9W7KXR0_9STRA|nr:hypothetical protein TL16_g04838 [Triparma laevis f. inornata]GMI15036.1 hypothetical protein TrLO_g2619 [Triparma laevis f. longispina]